MGRNHEPKFNFASFGGGKWGKIKRGEAENGTKNIFGD